MFLFFKAWLSATVVKTAKEILYTTGCRQNKLIKLRLFYALASVLCITQTEKEKNGRKQTLKQINFIMSNNTVEGSDIFVKSSN